MSYDTTILGSSGLVSYNTLKETSGLFLDTKNNFDMTTAGTVVRGQPSLNADNTKSIQLAGAGCVYVDRPNIIENYTEAWTLSAWFKIDNLAAVRQCLFYIGDKAGGSNDGTGIIFNGNDGTRPGSLWVLRQGLAWQDWGDVITDTNPHLMHVVRYLGGTNGIKFYIDGVKIAEFVVGWNPGSERFIVGSESITDFVEGGFVGRVQQVAFFDREIPLEETVQQYNSPSGTTDDTARMDQFIASMFHRHETGAAPYIKRYHEDGSPAASPAAEEHYDPLACFWNAEDLCKHLDHIPDDWSVQKDNARYMWYGFITGMASIGFNTLGHVYHHTHGLALDYLLDGNVTSRNLLQGICPDPWPTHSSVQQYWDSWGWNYWGRETAFRLMGNLDVYNCGLPAHSMLHEEAKLCLFHNEGYLNPDERYGRYTRPWMQGLAFRSLIYYWFTFRNSVDPAIIAILDQIPPICKAMINWSMSPGNGWYPAGTPVSIAFEGGTWDHGAFAYQWPAGNSPGYQNIIGLTIVSEETPSRVFTGPASLSSVDNYYRHLLIKTPGGGQAWVKDYEGATRKFTALGGINTTPGGTFDITTLGDDGVGGYAPSGAMPVGNTIVSPTAAFCYWHEKHILGNSAGAAIYRDYHQQIFDGGKMAWGNTFSQKEYNEGMIWGPLGIGYRDAGDANQDTQYESLGVTYINPDDPVSSYDAILEGDFSGLVGQPTGDLIVTLGVGTVAAPITFTFGFTGVTGSYSASTLILDDNTRSGSVTFTPTSDGTASLTITNDGGLPNPDPINYTVQPTSDTLEGYTMTLTGSASGSVGQPTGEIKIELGPGTAPGLITFTFSVTGVTGSLLNTTRLLNNTFRDGITVFTPTSVGTAVISVTNNAGLPNPAPIIYNVVEGFTEIIPIPTQTFLPLLTNGRMSLIIPRG